MALQVMEAPSSERSRLGRKILVGSAMLLTLTFSARIIGYLEKRSLAALFGTAAHLDAYFTAFQIGLFGHFLLKSLLRPIIVPLITEAKNCSLQKAKSLGLVAAILVFASLSLLAGGEALFVRQLVTLVAKGLSPESIEQCISLTLWFLPAAIVLALSQLMTASLQVQKRFFLSAVGETAQKISFVVLLWVWVAPFGFQWIGAAYLCCAMLMFFFYLAEHNLRYGAIPFKLQPSSALPLFNYTLPLAVGAGLGQIGRLYQNRIASELAPGSISGLTYAQTIIDLPLMLVSLSLSAVLFVYFSELSDRQEVRNSNRYLAISARWLMLIFAPFGVFLFCCRKEVVTVLLGGGRFSGEALELTSQALSTVSLGLPFLAVEMVMTSFFFAQKKYVTAVFAGAVGVASSALSLDLLSESLGLAGVGLYLPFARVVKLLLMIAFLPTLGFGVSWLRLLLFHIRLVLPLAAVGFLCAFLLAPVPSGTLPPFAHALTNLVLCASAAFPAYLVLLYVLKFPEARDLFERIQDLRSRLTAAGRRRVSK